MHGFNLLSKNANPQFLQLFSEFSTVKKIDRWSPLAGSFFYSGGRKCASGDGVGKKVRGRILAGRTHDGFPKRVTYPALPAGIRMQHALNIEQTALVQILA